MSTIRLFPGDVAIVGGAEITVDRAVTLSSTEEIRRRPTPGLREVPETGLRIGDLWRRDGHRVRMTVRQDLRCPCGSVYVRKSATYHSCQHCRRVWKNEDVDSVS